jgi:hypothetical protein
LAFEQNESERALADAKAAVDVAVRAVLIAQANSVAESTERLAAQAQAIRLQLGREFGPSTNCAAARRLPSGACE